MGDKLEDLIIEIIMEVNPYAETVTNEVELLSEGLIDSLKLMVIVSMLEEHLDCSISPDDLVPSNFVSVNAIRKFLENI